MIKKIWKDPVGSKLIAVAILGIVSLVYAKIESVALDISFIEALKGVYDIRIRIVYVVGGIILLLFLKNIFNNISKKEYGYYTKEQDELRKFNKIVDEDQGVKITWKVFFKFDKPFISDLTFFCTNHNGPPLRFIDDRCSIHDCENFRIGLDQYAVKNFIESELIDRWEKVKNGS